MSQKDKLSKSDIKKACDILRRDDGVGSNNYMEQISWLLFLKVFEEVEKELKELGFIKEDVIDKKYKWSSWAKKDWRNKDELIHFVNKELFPYLQGLKDSAEKEKISEIFREIRNRIESPYNMLDAIEIIDRIKMRHFKDTHLLSQAYEEILQEMVEGGNWSGEYYTPRSVIRFIIKVVEPEIGDKILDPFAGSGGFLIEAFQYLQKNNPNLGVKEWRKLQEETFYGQEKKPLPYLVGTMNMILHKILVPNIVRTNTLMEDIHSMPQSRKVDIILTNPPFGGKENKSVQENFPLKTASTEALALQYVMRRLKNGGRCGMVVPEGQLLFGGGVFQKIRERLLKKFDVIAIVSLPQGVFSQMGAGVKTDLIFFKKTNPTKEIWYGEVEGHFTKKNPIKDKHLKEIYEKWENKEESENSWTVAIEEIKERNFDLSPKNPNKEEDSGTFQPFDLLLEEIRNNQGEIEKILTNLKQIIQDES